MKNLSTLVIGERDVVENNVAPHVGTESLALVCFLLGLHDIGDTVNGDPGLAHLGNHTPQHTDRPGQHGGIGEKGDKLTGQHTALQTEHRTKHHDQQDLGTAQYVAGAPILGHGAGQLHPEAGVILILGIKAIPLHTLPTESTHDTHAGQVFLRHGGELALVFITLEKRLTDFAVEMK